MDAWDDGPDVVLPSILRRYRHHFAWRRNWHPVASSFDEQVDAMSDELPDDPRSGTWANIGQEEEEDAPIPGGASGSGLKRPADEPADDEGRGDAQGDGDDGMIGSVLPFECSHCSRRFRSRNTMFKHLYHSHDDDGEGAEKKIRDTLLQETGPAKAIANAAPGMEDMGVLALTRWPCP